MSALAIDRVIEIISDEASAMDGQVHSCVKAEDQLFMRTILGRREKVREGDEIESGVAVRVDGPKIWVRPYAYRLICANGSVFPVMADEDFIEASLLPTAEIQESRLRESFRDNAKGKHFSDWMSQVRRMSHHDPMTLALMYDYLRQDHDWIVLEALTMARRQGDISAYGLWNGVTALAREQSDPQRQWEMEEIGGKIPAWLEQHAPERVWEFEEEMPYTPDSLALA